MSNAAGAASHPLTGAPEFRSRVNNSGKTRRNRMPHVVENTANSRLIHRNANGREIKIRSREPLKFHLGEPVVPAPVKFHLGEPVVPAPVKFHLGEPVVPAPVKFHLGEPVVAKMAPPAVVETSPQIIPADVLLASIQAMTPMEAYEFRVMLDDKHRIIIKNNKRLAEKPALNEKLETFFNKPKLTKKEDIFIRYWGNEQEVYMLKEYYTKPQPIFPKHHEVTLVDSFFGDIAQITQFKAFEDLKDIFIEERTSLSVKLGNRVRELTAVAAVADGGINPKNIPELKRLIQEDQQNYFNFYQKWYSIITSRSKELGFIS